MTSPESANRPKVVAFYLPQFHPTPENDAWWGSGFTEWQKVAPARPQFEGHDQPQIPAELGFYDLRVPEVREQQSALAQAHGIDAFMYYHYWFDGRPVLNRPMEEVLASGRPDIEFALCWANESWYNTWQSNDGHTLIAQRHGPEEQAAHIAYLVGAFGDPRYLRVNGRPFFSIYMIDDLDDAEAFITELRAATLAADLPDPYIMVFDTYGNDYDPADYGCDASGQFFPHGQEQVIVDPGPPPAGAVPTNRYVEYDRAVQGYIDAPAPAWRHHECVSPGWDNTARRAGRGALIIHGNTPEAYERWLRAVVERAEDRAPDHGMVFINAWNEWAEGAHLEPDQTWGRAFLEATARVVLGEVPDPTEASIVEPEAADPASYPALYAELYRQHIQLQTKMTELDNLIHRESERRLARHRRELERERTRADLLENRLDRIMRRFVPPAIDVECADS